MPKILIKQFYSDGSCSIVYEGEKSNVVIFSGTSPNVERESIKVVTKDKMYDQLKVEREKNEKKEKQEET